MTNQIVLPKASNIFAITENDRRAAAALKMMLPYGHMLTDDNALALLLYGRAHDLDPLNGEAYFLVRESKDKQTGEVKRTELGCYPGIKGKRKHARASLLAQQGTYKISYEIVTNVAVLGLKPEDIAVCMKGELRDSVSEGQYLGNLVKLIAAGYAKDEIAGILGKPPTVTGYGVVKSNELWALKQPPAVVARKRCENDCITQRFDLPLIDDIADDAAPEITAVIEREDAAPEQLEAPREDVTEGEYTQAQEAQPVETKAKPRRTEQEIINALF